MPRMSLRALGAVVLTGLLAATAVAGCSSFQAELAEHEARLATAETAIVETTAGAIEYAAAGEGSPVLMLHGAGGGFDQGLLLAEMVLGGGHRVIAPSRFGYLGTAMRARSGAAAQAEAHAALMDALDIDRAAVVGVSAGGYSAIELAASRPERVSALVLVVPAMGPTESTLVNFAMRNPFVFDAVAGVADLAYWWLQSAAPRRLLRLTGVPPDVEAAAPAEDRSMVAELIEAAMPVSRRWSGIRNDALVLQELPPPRLDEVAAPILLVCARDDTLVDCGPAERAAEAIGAEVRVFDTGGHLLVGHHHEVRALVSDFLREAGG